MGISSEVWWQEVRSDEKKLNRWLVKQHRGEASASMKIVLFAQQYAPDDTSKRILNVIAEQERQHAEWILALLKTRGIESIVEKHEERYWNKTMPGIASFKTGCAVGAHAERMRLERIRAIANCDASPTDIWITFRKILKDEEFHERMFTMLAGQEALEQTLSNHTAGREILGLEP
jgi:rubrerythrin